MSKKVLLALLLVAFVAIPAFASVQNIKVGGSVDSTWLYRTNFDLGTNPIGDEVQNLAITQTMLQVDSDLTDNVSATVCLINERPWTQKTGSVAGDNINIHYAYATLREMLYSPLTVVVGRQAFKYGNSFVVDSTGSNNSAPNDSGIQSVAGDLTKQTAQDAVRLIFDYNPLTVELLWSKISANTTTLANDDEDDVDLYGANLGYELGDSWNSLVEAYFFARIDKSFSDPNANTADFEQEPDTIYVPGIRASTNPIEGLNVQAELAWQGGNKVLTTTQNLGSARRSAVGAQFIANYQVPLLEEYKPAVQYTYTYVSGDKNTSSVPVRGQNSSEEWVAWDPMFENQAGGKVYNAILNLTNLHIHAAEVSVSPIEDVTTKFSWSGLWLDKKFDATTLELVQPDSTTTQTVNISRDEEDVGFELDFDAVYDYTEDVQIGASLGWFFPGDLFDKATASEGTVHRSEPDGVAKQVLVHANVNF